MPLEETCGEKSQVGCARATRWGGGGLQRRLAEVCQRTRQARMQRVLTKAGAGRAVQDTQVACGNALGQQ